jgi:hypothetical protein
MDLTKILELIGLSTQVVVQGAFLIIASNRIVEGLCKPLFQRFKWDDFWLMYVSWGVGGLLTALGEINLFVTVLPEVIWGVLPGRIVGIVLSALVAGGGANLINDLLKAIAGRAGPQIMHKPHAN